MIRKLSEHKWTIIFFILFALFVYFVLPVSIPLIVAFITALILNPFVRFVQLRTKLNRQFAVTIVFIVFLLLIGFTGTFFVTKAVGQIVIFVEEMPSHVNEIYHIYEKLEADFKHYTQNLPPEFFRQISSSVLENLNALNDTIKEKITLDKIAQIFSKVPQYLISFIVFIIALFLFMLELPLLKAKAYQLLTEETARKVRFMNKRLADVFLGFIKAQFLLSLIILFVSLIGLLFIAKEVALLMAIIIWIVDLIPIIGSIIILGPWALYMFLVGDISMGIKLSILAIILLAIRRIIEPKLMGVHIGLSPLATLIAMFLGVKLLGVIGFILGPLIVIAFTSAKEAGIINWDMKI